MAAPARPVGARAKTGIPVLDERLQGGFPRPSTLLLFSDKPTEKRIFGENFAVQGIRAGERSLYVDFFRAPQLARGELKRFGSGDLSNLVPSMPTRPHSPCPIGSRTPTTTSGASRTSARPSSRPPGPR